MLSTAAVTILQRLHTAGYEAYAVGGCVRDLLRGLPPADIDITTSALPNETIALFSDVTVVPSGLSYGTVTVIIEHTPIEVTTFRTDGAYSDGRHPDAVRFTVSLEEDLARRDFTVNAMALHPDGRIIDPFGGQRDLQDRRLRCVGEADTRFSEDALRIARLVRFMSTLNFDVDPETAAAAHRLCSQLHRVAPERKRVELIKMLSGDGFLRAAEQFDDVLCAMIPSLKPTRGFDQRNPHHDFDIYTHSARAVHFAPKELTVRLSALLHDIGKTETFSVDENGIGHFYGHAQRGEQLASKTLKALRFDNRTIDTVATLVKYHDATIFPTARSVRRWLSRLGEKRFRALLALKAADASACKQETTSIDQRTILEMIDTILAANDCLNLSSLAINGHDLLSLGIPAGPAIGKWLSFALEAVMAEECPNEKEVLLRKIKERCEDV